MIVDSKYDTAQSYSVWYKKRIPVIAGATYEFSYFVLPTLRDTPAFWSRPTLELMADTQHLDTFAIDSLAPNTWTQRCAKYVAQTTGFITIRIRHLAPFPNKGYHDFGLDNISFRECLPSPCDIKGSITKSINSCSGTFSVSTSPPPELTIISTNWSFGDGTGGSGKSIRHDFKSTGTFKVCAELAFFNTNTRECCVRRYCTKVVITSVCTTCDFSGVSIQHKQNNRCCTHEFSVTSSHNTSVLGTYWDFGDNKSASGSSVEHRFKYQGNYTVCAFVVGKNGSSCCSDSFCITVNDTCSNPSPATPMSADQNKGTSGKGVEAFRLYPNPAESNFTVEFDQTVDGRVFLDVLDIHGKRVQVLVNGQMINQGHQLMTFSSAGLSPGIYFLHLERNGQHTVEKVVIQNR